MRYHDAGIVIVAEKSVMPSEPALSDVAFEAKYKGATEAIPGGFTPPAG